MRNFEYTNFCDFFFVDVHQIFYCLKNLGAISMHSFWHSSVGLTISDTEHKKMKTLLTVEIKEKHKKTNISMCSLQFTFCCWCRYCLGQQKKKKEEKKERRLKVGRQQNKIFDLFLVFKNDINHYQKRK